MFARSLFGDVRGGAPLRFLMGYLRIGKEKQAPRTRKTYCTPWLRAQRRHPVRNNSESHQLLHVDPQGALNAIDRAHLVRMGSSPVRSPVVELQPGKMKAICAGRTILLSMGV
jgi:hypothetical protein